MIVPQSMLNFLKIFPKNHIWLRTGEAQKPLAQQLNPPALSYWPQLPLHATSKEFLYQNLGTGDEGKRESPQSFCILVSQTMLFLNLWWSPAREPRPIFFYLLFIIPMEKHIYCLVFFFRFFRVDSWNPEYPYVTPVLLREKRMSFLLLTLVVSLEVELKPPCYKEATSHVQQ